MSGESPGGAAAGRGGLRRAADRVRFAHRREGLAVGQVADVGARTGCTVVLRPCRGMWAATHVRGGATGTREVDPPSPRHLVPSVPGFADPTA